MRVRTTFIGQHGSCGFKNEETYTLELSVSISEEFGKCTKIEDIREPSRCCLYGSVITFLENWANITVLKK